jgi:hypothetical protein
MGTIGAGSGSGGGSGTVGPLNPGINPSFMKRPRH